MYSTMEVDALPRIDHDPLVRRLVDILTRLNSGEALLPQELAREYSVTPRTVQRDLNERFSYLPLVRNGKTYRIDPAFLGKIGMEDIRRFASLAGLRGLFPALDNEFLREIFDHRLSGTLLVKGHHYESLKGRERLFRSLQKAISEHRRISFRYPSGEEQKVYEASPYKLVNSKGIWYLAAKDGDMLKSFTFSKIANMLVLDDIFTPDAEDIRAIEEEDGIWLSREKQEVLLKIDAEVEQYFRRRALVPNQEIAHELEGGGLIVASRVAHRDQILPIVRYWIPHIRIISPEAWQEEIKETIINYIKTQS